MFKGDSLRKFAILLVLLWGGVMLLSLQGCMDNGIYYPDPDDPMRDDAYIEVEYSGEYGLFGEVEYYDGELHQWIRIQQGEKRFPVPHAVSIDLDIERTTDDGKEIIVTLYSVGKLVKEISFTSKEENFTWTSTR